MKRQYDYFEKVGGLVRLYRVPRGETGPVEYSSTIGNGWFGSQYTSRADMQQSGNGFRFRNIDAKRAQEICHVEPVEPVETLKVEIPLADRVTIEYKYKGFGIEIAVVKLP